MSPREGEGVKGKRTQMRTWGGFKQGWTSIFGKKNRSTVLPGDEKLLQGERLFDGEEKRLS